MPCSDSNECDRNTTTQQTTISQADNHHEKQSHDNELCSPFCTCSHCPASAFFHPTEKYKIEKKIFIEVAKQFSQYNFHYSQEISSNIWQPPKLS